MSRPTIAVTNLPGGSRRYSERVRPSSVRIETSSPPVTASQPAGVSIPTRAVARSSLVGRGYQAVRFEYTSGGRSTNPSSP